ncbi:hypothetical protein C8F01DRAFT_1094442 [Mycena amicta]|nr:hypothetical protein C8F01DRAFT_1094442 [Mycena amicta]
MIGSSEAAARGEHLRLRGSARVALRLSDKKYEIKTNNRKLDVLVMSQPRVNRASVGISGTLSELYLRRLASEKIGRTHDVVGGTAQKELALLKRDTGRTLPSRPVSATFSSRGTGGMASGAHVLHGLWSIPEGASATEERRLRGRMNYRRPGGEKTHSVAAYPKSESIGIRQDFGRGLNGKRSLHVGLGLSERHASERRDCMVGLWSSAEGTSVAEEPLRGTGRILRGHGSTQRKEKKRKEKMASQHIPRPSRSVSASSQDAGEVNGAPNERLGLSWLDERRGKWQMHKEGEEQYFRYGTA